MASTLSFHGLNSFNPEQICGMSAALDSAWQQLAAAGRVETMPFRAKLTRERMARAILAVARTGEIDPQQLVLAALRTTFAERRGQVDAKKELTMAGT